LVSEAGRVLLSRGRVLLQLSINECSGDLALFQRVAGRYPDQDWRKRCVVSGGYVDGDQHVQSHWERSLSWQPGVALWAFFAQEAYLSH